MTRTLFSLLLVAASDLGAQVWIAPPSGPASSLAVFGGENAPLTLKVASTKPGAISLSYSLHQLTGFPGGLAVPLETGRTLGDPVEGGAGIVRTVPVRIPIPPVQRPTTMMVTFFPSAAAGSAGPGLERALLKVFPKPRRGEWARALAVAEEDSGRKLAVFGKSRRVRDFLEAEGIAFRDLGDEFPAEFPTALLVVGEVTLETLEKHRPKTAGGRKVFFVEDTMQPPGIYEVVEPSGSLTKVTLPMSDGLAADPQMQIAFIALLHRQLNLTSP